MADPYLYPGAMVLGNKAGIRDADVLAAFEGASSASRLETLSPTFPVSSKGYCAIHRHIFGAVYAWAGEYRTVDMAKGSSYFCRSLFIAAEMENRFRKIGSENYLQRLGSSDFAARAADHLSELNAIHPFREGNGRTQRAFLVTLGHQAGHAIDLQRFSPEAWGEASRIGFQKGDNALLRDIIAYAISTPPGAPDR